PAQATSADLESLTCRGALRCMNGDLSEAHEDLSVVVRTYRAGSRCAMGYASFCYLTAVQYLLGAWDNAALTAYQGLAMAEASEQVFHYALMRLAASLVPAGRGDHQAAIAHIRAARHSARNLGTPQDHRYAAIAGAIHAQASADYPAMLEALRPVRDLTTTQARTEHVWWQLWWRPLLVEALIGTGNLAEAGRELTELAQVAHGVTYLTTVLGRLEGWLSERRGNSHCALTHYQRAVSSPVDDADPPLYRGMLEASLGRFQLGVGHRDAAVEYLRTAHQRFTTLGAVPFARRCEADLARCGLGPMHTTPSHPPLSEREYQVVRLVEQGMTNREIAAELYLSSKTIEYHLANVFAKLGITSRRQLRNRIPSTS
ncbi:MAG: helix-turn-helix transcriptional regulator, partial [Pseudonocardiaceae bacterium]